MNWFLNPENSQEVNNAFANLDNTFAIQGEQITQDPLSRVLKVKIGTSYFYVKRYHQAGKHLRRFAGPSRIKTEWRNLLFFKQLGIPTIPIVAYGEERQYGIFKRGAMISEELTNTIDLKTLAEQQSELLKSSAWCSKVINQVAQYTRLLHQHQFVHNDLKWRNILVTPTTQPAVYFIDCPAGSFWPGWLLTPFRNYRMIKDLACLDKVAKYQLRRTQRLAFYKAYRNRKTLTGDDKKQIHKILNFFNNRE